MSTACAQPDMSGWDTPDSCSYLTDGYQTCLEGGFPGVVGMGFHDHSVSTQFWRASCPSERKPGAFHFPNEISFPAKRARRVGL